MRTASPPSAFSRAPLALLSIILVLTFGHAPAVEAQSSPADGPRVLTFLDMQKMSSAGSTTPSPDGRWMLYTVSTPDWEEARQQSDIHLVSLEEGVSSSRQLTFTTDRNESSPGWSRDGSFFVFSSNRDSDARGISGNQLYLMRPDGGEARRITSARDGVSNFAFSRDGAWLVFRAGKSGEQQLFRTPVAALESGGAEAEQITRQGAGVNQWQIAPDSRRVYFVAPDSVDTDEKLRREKRFTVDVYNMETPLQSLWAVDLDPVTETRLTRDPSYTVAGFSISDDSRRLGFRATSSARYERNITEQGLHTELYLLDVASGDIEQLTDAPEVNKSGPDFSPDGRWVAFSASRDLSGYNMKNRRVYLRAVDDRGGDFRMLGDDFDGDVGINFWSADGNTIYFNTGIRTTRQLLALDVRRNTVRQLTDVEGALTVSRDEDSGVLLLNYSDGATPSAHYTVASLDQAGDPSAWRQLTDANPHVRNFALGEQREVTWRSTDGREVGGVLVLPVGYREGQRYPLIVAIHGGPASADLNSFNGGYGSQVYAGAGYAVLRPNYRGSTNYGEAHKTDIIGNYFPQGYDDIMTGVDHLIAQGIVDGDRMGALGWSAGGHWSNWILVNTDRFKAISSGAGTSNWISMYAQSDVQRNRQHYLGDRLPYYDFEPYWDQSPIKYIENARTPTMIHVVQGDPRVPSPQSVELHMALRQLGVPTELFMYPGQSHGIPDPRNRLAKSMSEMAWMDYYVRGSGQKFAWRSVLETLEPASGTPAAANAADGSDGSDGSDRNDGGAHR
jgi:dipeptidyl aminopeptidase/acylaminoacyl peptidase